MDILFKCRNILTIIKKLYVIVFVIFVKYNILIYSSFVSDAWLHMYDMYVLLSHTNPNDIVTLIESNKL